MKSEKNTTITDYRYDGVPCSEHPQEIIRAYIAENFFLCPRCGMVFLKNSKHNYGICCSFCATDEDLRKIKEHKEQIRKQMNELQEEIERKLKNEITKKNY